MVTSSPEYSITKPGLHHVRKRAKPLRTYGRQPSAPEDRSEPPPKKRRLSALKQQDQQQEEKPGSTPESSNGAPEREATPPAPLSETKAATHDASNQTKPAAKCAPSSKGSILSYFKPSSAPPNSKDETQPPPPPPQESNPQPEDEQSIPPDSPPKRKQPSRRKPRLLKIKPVTHDPLDEPSEEQDETPRTSDETTPQSSTTLNAHTKASKPNASSTSTSRSTSPSSPSSSSRKTSLRSHQKPRPSKPPPPSVQTTLNISAKAAFSECKICDTVWNPLYPDDVKFHNKTHKAVLRAQRKRMMDEL
ncbi:hypothetical protein HDV57DRAFT_483093 [Trichoderma longibrachiatum]|uniref:N-acetyltransferase ESCO zinc-finger domain-containing protein n=1 Tax=Trichoderma longibrachiatum ATCC 18648 TaxID=983965 RepID=A0A2T4C8C4_TRILO|nr:hypothetical protein M440DRAFT_1400755 [Trichoderma longibrachiatum ATCC 18648]